MNENPKSNQSVNGSNLSIREYCLIKVIAGIASNMERANGRRDNKQVAQDAKEITDEICKVIDDPNYEPEPKK